MFIIFASPRSGTTLLASTLHLHDAIVVPDETDFIVPTAFIVDRVKDPAIGKPLLQTLIPSTARFARSLGEYLSEADVHDAIAAADYSTGALLTSIYAAVARKAGKTIAGDKSPNDLNFIRILAKTGLLESGIKIIHLVRDVRDVVLSLKAVEWENPSDIETYFPRFWCNANLYLHGRGQSRPQQYLFLRYEDLVTDPRRELGRIIDFLGLPWQDKLMDPSARAARYTGVRDHRNLQQPFLPHRASAWRRQMSPALQAICEKQAREALETLGYGVER